jgi:hypothetical protein
VGERLFGYKKAQFCTNSKCLQLKREGRGILGKYAALQLKFYSSLGARKWNVVYKSCMCTKLKEGKLHATVVPDFATGFSW